MGFFKKKPKKEETHDVPKTYLEELHEEHNTFEKNAAIIRDYLNVDKIQNHLKRIINLVLNDYLYGLNIWKIKNNKYKRQVLEVEILDDRVKIDSHNFDIFCKKYEKLIRFDLMSRASHQDLLAVDIGYFIEEEIMYEKRKIQYPLFYETYEMDDEDFEIWFRLNY
jgi:hypothetical protein